MDDNTSNKIPGRSQQLEIETTLQSMLAALDPGVAAKVSTKYEMDRLTFLREFKAHTKNRGVNSWAKKSCKKCYGRGFVGLELRTNRHLECVCAVRNYTKEMQAFRVVYNAREDTNGKISTD